MMRTAIDSDSAIQRFVALAMSLVLVLCGCNVQNFAYAGEADGADDASIDVLLSECSGASDPDYLQLTENIVVESLAASLDSSQYIVEGAQATYLSQEYLEELVYNSQANVFFGYTLEDLDAAFQGTRYVFDLGDDGTTVVREMEGYVDEFAQTMQRIVGNVAVGAGAICIYATLAPVAAAALPVLAVFIVDASTVGAFALGGAALGGVVSGTVTGIQTLLRPNEWLSHPSSP